MNSNSVICNLSLLTRISTINWTVWALCSAFLIVWVCPVYAQQGNIRVSGKITALDDKQPVPHASINIGNKGIGTATNANGLFALIIPAANISDTLKISCVGFKTKQLPINSLRNGENLLIAFEKNTTELKEVTVVYYDAAKIIQKAIERIPENYIGSQHVLRGFYRVYAFADNAPLQLSEAVFDVFNFGYADKRADQFRLIKARNEKNERDFNALELGQKPNSIFIDDIINHRQASGFLSDDGMEKHQFHVSGIADFQGRKVYEVDFEEKAASAIGTFRGRMFIDMQSYAFMYFDFGLSPASLSVWKPGSFITQAVVKIRNVEADFKDDHTQVTYQEVGRKWVLANVVSSYVLVIREPAATDELAAHVKFNYQVTAVDTAPKDSFNSNLYRNDSINNHASDAGAGFWKDYNIVLSDENTEEIFGKIQAVNKANKQKVK